MGTVYIARLIKRVAYTLKSRTLRHDTFKLRYSGPDKIVQLCVELLRYRYGLRRLKAERHKAEGADRARLAYVKNFLELCVSTSRRLNSLCRLVGRKISANQVEQLYDYTRSGRIIEEQRLLHI